MTLAGIVDCPSNVTITPSGDESSFKAGDELTCSSDGHPQPTYIWIDPHTGAPVTSGSTTKLSEGSFNLTCVASSNITSACSANLTVSGTASGKNDVVAVVGKKYFGGLAPHHLGGNNG